MIDTERLKNAVEKRDLDDLVALERAEHEEEQASGARTILFGARYGMALLPGIEAALATVDILRTRRLLDRPATDHVPPGCSHAPPGSIVRTKNGAVLHADWAARFYGAVLAFTHVTNAAHVVESMVERFGVTPDLHDLYACFVHECVLRGASLRASSAATRVVEALGAARHPLATLPLERLPLEAGVEAHASDYRSTSSGGWHATSPPDADVPAAAPRTFNDVTSSADARICAAFDSHQLVSNGKAEGRVFLVDPAIGPSDDPTSLLRALAEVPTLACLRGLASDSEALRGGLLSPADVLHALVAFASNGGDYNTAWSGAYGRLAAWHSLAGLVDARRDATPAEVAARASACRFVGFRARTSWFYRIVTDFGVVAVREDGASVAVLAGSDTD